MRNKARCLTDRRIATAMVTFMAVVCCGGAFAEERSDTLLNPFPDLIEIIVSEMNESEGIEEIPELIDLVLQNKETDEEAGSSEKNDDNEERIPLSLEEIVRSYYAEEIVEDDVPIGVLDFLTNVYSDRGYYETGAWVKKKGYRHFYPYAPENLIEFTDEDFHVPAGGTITSGYGYRRRFGRFHYGVDIGVNSGDTVRSALPGVVTVSGYDPRGYGNYIIVAHSGGWETLYGHLSYGLVVPGEIIEKGKEIGICGETGNATGPHLHFETRYQGVPVDPRSWLDRKNSKNAPPTSKE